MSRLSKTGSDVAEIGPEFRLTIAAVKKLAFDLLTELEHMRPSPNLDAGIDIRDEVLRYEVELIRCALRLTGNHQGRAAIILGAKLTTLNSKIKRYKIRP